MAKPKPQKAKKSPAKAKESPPVAKKKKAVGKPRRKFTNDQIYQMGQYALAGCKTNTIASLMGIPRETIDSRPDIQQLLTKKRAERKLRLLKQQNTAAQKGNPAILIWLGKNVLDQKDRTDTIIGITDDLSELMKDIGSNGDGLPIKT